MDFTASNLQPILPPGIALFPGYTALKQEIFLLKETLKDIVRGSYTISPIPLSGSETESILDIRADGSKGMVFRNPTTKQEVMRIKRERHTFKPTVYRGFAPDGTEMWSLKLKTSLNGTDYLLDVAPPSNLPAPLSVSNKVLGHDKGILLNGNPVAVMSRSETWEHIRRQDVISVAPGMDILLALGVAWIRVDKQNRDAMNYIGAM